MDIIARRLTTLQEGLRPLLDFLSGSAHARRQGDPTIADFVFGNPHEMPLDGFVETIRHHAVPEDKNWFAYTVHNQSAAEAVAASLQARTGLAFEPDDVRFAPGTFGALSSVLRTLVDDGDEVIFLSPPWFFYESMIAVLGATPVRVTLRGPRYGLDADAIRAAITSRTRAVIVNSPHNPTGRIYDRAELDALAAALDAASGRRERPIVLISDESYNRILFGGRTFVSPAAAYRHTLILYTYGKQLLAPGERIGYIAVSPRIGGRMALREALRLSQIVGGWQIPSATLQRAVPDLESLSIDLGALERRRDRLGAALTKMGYEVTIPDATFYMMVRSPIADERAFVDRLARHDVFVGPGDLFEMPGYFRISLTANDDMVTRALPGFSAARQEALAQGS
jgi:aspartate aminotransferase